MIYLVSKNKSLFKSDKYEEIDIDKSLDILSPLKEVQLDTETSGLDCHTKELLTIQLGCTENQVVYDWTTLTKEEKLRLKEYLESDRLFIGWNLAFDLCFLYKQNIWPKHIWDGMIAEKLLWLGYPAGMHEMSLKAAAWNYLQYDLDKSVRGTIIQQGLTESVIVYAAGDVMWLEKIKEAQEAELTKQNLHKAVKFECEFIKSIAYFKFCGVHLDPIKWESKMQKDTNRLNEAVRNLNQWVIDWFENQGANEYSKEIKVKYLYSDTEKNPFDKMWDNKIIEEDKIYLEYTLPINASKWVFRDLQGDLFEGFNDHLQCIINWSSSKQVIALFKTLGIEVKTFDKKTKKEKESIEEKQLSPQKDRFPIIPLFLEYQKAAKVVSTYGQNWLDAINKNTGRIHPDYYSIGTDTGRVSSGGGLSKVNVQNLPHDPETRACFTPAKGNKFVCIDYSGQESCITASVANDSTMIEILKTGGDIHCEVARASWPDILKDLSDKEIKEKYHDLRFHAKGIEFSVFYGGDANTIHQNKGFPIQESERIYNGFMKRFSGISAYQDYCRKAVMDKGYILMNPVTGHRAHIYDFEELSEIKSKMSEPGFWEYYRDLKKEDPSSYTVQQVRHFFQRKSASEKQSINYRIFVCDLEQ